MMTSAHSGLQAAQLPATRQVSNRTGTIAGAAIGGIAGLVVARAVSSRLSSYAAFGAGGAAAGAFVGYVLSARSGSTEPTPNPVRDVGVAYGRRMIDRGDGTSEWASVTAPLLLSRQVGAMEGYATLAAAIAETNPNSGADELAYIRKDGSIQAFRLIAPELEAVQGYRATAEDVIAYTTRESGHIHAGPAATAQEREFNKLADPLPAPF